LLKIVRTAMDLRNWIPMANPLTTFIKEVDSGVLLCSFVTMG
jgi:hypothetical protein